MKFKFSKILSEKQVFRAKWSFSATLMLIGYLITKDYFVAAVEEGPLVYNDETWNKDELVKYPRGNIHYFSMNTVVCNR
jgi:hypothetical protein